MNTVFVVSMRGTDPVGDTFTATFATPTHPSVETVEARFTTMMGGLSRVFSVFASDFTDAFEVSFEMWNERCIGWADVVEVEFVS